MDTAQDKPSFVIISSDDTRKEFDNKKDDDFIFYVVDMRIRIALSRGITVIYDDMNLDKKTRQHYIELAGSVNKELYLMNSDNADVSQQMAMRLYSQIPDISEGWDCVHEYGERPTDFLSK